MQGEGTVKNTLLAGLAELIGTSMLVFLGCMGCVGSLGVVPSGLQIALTFGLVVMVVIQVSGLYQKLVWPLFGTVNYSSVLSYLCQHLKVDKGIIILY